VSRRVLLAGVWDEGPGYPRTTSLRMGLQAAGFEVRECRRPGLGVQKQTLLRAPWRWPGVAWQQRRQLQELLAELRAEVTASRPECVVVPYPGHRVIGAIARAVQVPVVLDLFLSAYDTVVEDRRLVLPGSLGAWWLQHLDTAACRAADVVLLDTPANAAYVAALTGLPPERFAWLPVHDPDAPPSAATWSGAGDRLRVLFFGTGVPLHGLDTLVEAVARVPQVQLTLVGGSPAHRALAAARLGARLELLPVFVDRAALHDQLARCQLVAGVFGDSGKAQRVVPFKLVHALAAGRPVLTADTPAVGQWLDGSGAVFGVPAGDAGALAAELERLAREPGRVQAAAALARPTYDRHFGTAQLAARWRRLLNGLTPAGEVAA
jgi:glycosyltransferase involved in cell wall biosynthesis